MEFMGFCSGLWPVLPWSCPPMTNPNLFHSYLIPLPKNVYKIMPYLIWKVQSNCTSWVCPIIQTLYQWPVLHLLCAWHVWLQQRENSVSTSRHWQGRRVFCIRHCTQDVSASVGEHRRCAIVYISQHHRCITTLRYDVDGLVIHHEHELESKLIFGWTTSK
jgi:hypothetical protein